MSRKSPEGQRRVSDDRLVVDVVVYASLRPVRGLAKWLQSVAPSRTRGSVSVAVVPDARIRALNRRFRGKNAVTDVLSFPDGENGRLGDVVIAAGRAVRQARQARHSREDEIRVLALHGLLHLLGYDHDSGEGQMARLEARLSRKGGMSLSVLERAARAP